MLPGIVGTIQATEAIKVLLGLGEPLSGKLLTFDTLSMNFRFLKIYRDPECPIPHGEASEREEERSPEAEAQPV